MRFRRTSEQMEPSSLEQLRDFSRFLTDNKEVLATITAVASTLATFALAFLTYRYVRITEGMLKEARESHNPVVVLDWQNEESKFTISVHNVGKSPAANIRINCIGTNIYWKEYNNPPGFISYIAPDSKLTYFIGIVDNDEIDRIWREINRPKGFWEGIFKRTLAQPSLAIEYEYECAIYTYEDYRSKRKLVFHQKPFYNRLTVILDSRVLLAVKSSSLRM